MTALLVLFGVSLVARWVYLWMEWSQDRVRRQMLREIARWRLEQRKFRRNHTPDGSAGSDGRLPQSVPSVRVGVEPPVPAAPPTPSAPVDTSDSRTSPCPPASTSTPSRKGILP